jgi:hypothetical protein
MLPSYQTKITISFNIQPIKHHQQNIHTNDKLTSPTGIKKVAATINTKLHIQTVKKSIKII